MTRADFLPVTLDDARQRGWERLDVVLVTGDAYVDHPSFGVAVIGRLLESRGYRVGILSRPDWRSADAFRALGRPRLFFGVTGGNIDAALVRLTAERKPRSDDPYAPGGVAGGRPDRPAVAYAQRCREAFAGVPVVLGGLEASLRRLAHHDFAAQVIRRSILADSKADLLVYGMGERQILAIARRLAAGEPAAALGVPGVARLLGARDSAAALAVLSARPGDALPVLLPSFEEVAADPRLFARMARLAEDEASPFSGRPLLQMHGDRAVQVAPPARPLDGLRLPGDPDSVTLDEVHELPYARRAHPDAGDVPALRTVEHSIATTRGCAGGCAFCSLTAHEGKTVQSRSPESVLREVAALARRPGWKGVVSDLGGPTANLFGARCRRPDLQAVCRRPSCLHPAVCAHFDDDQGAFIDLLRRVRAAPGVRHAFIASGIRLDVALRHPESIDELARHHTGGQLSVAPEHAAPVVLRLMRKPGAEIYDRFAERFARASREAGREQYLVPYFIAGHPGATLGDAVLLALWLRARGLRPRQVQEFIPTPMTRATAMHVSGIDPGTGNPVATSPGLTDLRLHKALLLYWDPAWHELAREALRRVGRVDLFGDLVPR